MWGFKKVLFSVQISRTFNSHQLVMSQHCAQMFSFSSIQKCVQQKYVYICFCGILHKVEMHCSLSLRKILLPLLVLGLWLPTGAEHGTRDGGCCH